MLGKVLAVLNNADQAVKELVILRDSLSLTMPALRVNSERLITNTLYGEIKITF